MIDSKTPPILSSDICPLRYERTVWPSVLPSTQPVHRTPLTLVTANPWTLGLLDTADTVDRAELYTAQSYYLTP